MLLRKQPVTDRSADEATWSNNHVTDSKMPTLHCIRTVREIKWALHYAGGHLEIRNAGSRKYTYVPHLPQDNPDETAPHGEFTRLELMVWANETGCGTFNLAKKPKRIAAEVDNASLAVHT